MTTSEERTIWLGKITKLKVDKASGDPAPHKPLLLLVICELAELGALGTLILPLTGELAFRFTGYWTVVAARRTKGPEVRMPLYHLKREGFWQPLDKYGEPAVDKKLTTQVRFDPGFLACLQEPQFRRQARLLLITTYFRPQEQVALGSLLDLDIPSQNVVREQLPDYNTEQAIQQGREARFRLTVVPAYDYTCALTRYRLVTVGSGSIVDAAHIHKFADSRNNDPANGIALCKNAHWLFDQGLWSLDDDYRVLVSHERFEEAGPASYLLREFEHAPIMQPVNPIYLPSRKCLAWHRAHHGFDRNTGAK